ncbi:lysylphosphatidylglycerol synthase domain-containing protein [Parasphingorhabdus marina]|uniref:lysylphosphatidylglycerol synthase domain-containing protein n=1 Tax=Parasphingorhabdus marina TaxID=394732 RepID=UPI00135663C3|nr:lysylphosphatidylglycerol synthase domain-containing protein [Parasphingorhabdus marina]
MPEILRKFLAVADHVMGLIPMKSPRFRRSVLIVAVLALVAGIYLSLRNQPELLQDVQWTPLVVLALFAVPVTMFFNALEFVLSARLIGHRVGMKSAVETTIVGSVANLLPIPGGAIVRVAALKSEGASVAKGTSTMIFVVAIWAAVSFGYSGIWLVAGGIGMLGLLFLMIGLAGAIACFAMSRQLLDDSLITAQLFACKFGLVLFDALRLYLCLLALGVMAGFGQASVLTVSGFVGASFSIVPAGLGIREGVSALLGPLVGLTAAAAFMASAANRLVGFAVSAPLAAILAWKTDHSDKPQMPAKGNET